MSRRGSEEPGTSQQADDGLQPGSSKVQTDKPQAAASPEIEVCATQRGKWRKVGSLSQFSQFDEEPQEDFFRTSRSFDSEMSAPAGTQVRSNQTLLKSWGGLRQKWKLLGLFEINEKHVFFDLTRMMKQGLSAAIQLTIDTPPPLELPDKDFRNKSKKNHEDFFMKTFAGTVFATLRKSLGMKEEDYQQSLCSDSCYLQFISNSKSQAYFFLTGDKRFFLKTQSKREIRFILTHLKVYLEYLKSYPHSLLVKILGVYKIQVSPTRKRYFIIMQSVFYPDERLKARYDIKACEVSRWTNPVPVDKHIIMVYKDLNFEGQFITVDQQRSWLLRQVEVDTNFLCGLNVLDYSLLVAHQPLHPDERRPNNSFANVILRTKKSVYGSKSADSQTVSEAAAANNSESTEGSSAHLLDGSESECSESETISSEDFYAQNRRLLPNLKNALHIIDGPEERYFIGIVDIFTVYSFRKRLEHMWKKIIHPVRTFSTVSPQEYSLRIVQWVKDHTK